MITVQILINGKVILARSARNIRVAPDDEESEYHLDDGYCLLHKRKDGAVKLAIKMLQWVEEP